ncbi:MAG: outer membrane protein assembly factor BamA [Chitinispirillaceae bacterium]
MTHSKTATAFLLLIMTACKIFSQDSVDVDLNIQLTRETLHSEELLNTARKLISVSEKQPFDSLKTQESIQALRLCGLFESISVDRDNRQLVFKLTPARFIRDIQIKNTFPLFEEDVQRALTIYPGDIFRRSELERQDTLIGDLYKRQGFLSPRVNISSKKHPDSDNRIVVVDITPGEYLRVNTLEIEGNHATFELDIKRRMESWWTSFLPGRAGRFVNDVFEKDIQELVQSYRSKRFADVFIRDSIIIDSLRQTVDIFLFIEEGPRYEIRFSGNESLGIGRSDLKKELTLFETGNRNNNGVIRSKSAMKSSLRNAGFLDAQVKADDTVYHKRGFDRKEVTFTITPGRRTTVSSIEINGADQIDEESIRGQMLTVDKGSEIKRAFNPDVLQTDLFAINMLYYSSGFLNAELSHSVDIRNESVNITIDIIEGKQTFVGKVFFDKSQVTGITTDGIITVGNGDIFNQSKLKESAGNLQNRIAELGYAYAAVTPHITMTQDSSTADIEFLINRGPLVRLGSLQFVGAFRTRDNLLHRAVAADTGKPLSLTNIVESQRKIRDLDLFSSVQFKTIGLQEKWDTVHVFVDVTEKRPYYGKVGGGYQSDKGLFMNALAGDRNVLGRNKEAWVSGEYSLTGYGGRIGLEDPRFLSLPLSALIKVSAEKNSELNQDWETVSYGISAGLNNSPGEHTELGLGINYERRKLNYTDGVASGDITDDDRPRNLLVLKPSLTYDRRNSFTRPQKGSSFHSSVDISRGLGSSTDNFVKIRIESQGYITPFSGLTLAAVVRGGYLYSYGETSSVSADQLFYLGGTGDVRGFAENLLYPDSSGGTVSFSASIEARIMLGFNTELALFADAGQLEDGLGSVSPVRFRSSVGTGFRYITPIGPVGILYGWKLDRRAEEDMGAFHFSLGYTF